VKKVFDAIKQTLTDFSPADYQAAAKGQVAPQQQRQSGDEQKPSPTNTVTKSRTTLSLNRVDGMIKPITSVDSPADSADENSNITNSPASVFPESEPVTDSPIVDTANDNLNQNFNISPSPSSPPPEGCPQSGRGGSESAAALRTHATRPVSKPKKETAPNDMIPMNLRIPLYLKDAFFKTCRDKGTQPSAILRNLIKQYCGLCLTLFVPAVLSVLFLSPTLTSAQTDSKGVTRNAPTGTATTYTTDQIMKYLQEKSFSGLSKNIPNARGTIGARHALWQAGASDNFDDFTYTGHSNTRLEARIEIPIFDLSYLRNKDKEKLEHRAFVMKSLSRILAAQKSVNIIETRITTVRQRREYMNTQVNLKLANRSDLFGIEDNLFSLQSQLFESQSTLEQRVIELAMLAESDWLEAYNMIIKWDGILFKDNKKR